MMENAAALKVAHVQRELQPPPPPGCLQELWVHLGVSSVSQALKKVIVGGMISSLEEKISRVASAATERPARRTESKKNDQMSRGPQTSLAVLF